MGKWRDEHLRIEGDAVKDLQRLFIADWARVTDECLDLRRYVAARHPGSACRSSWPGRKGPRGLTIARGFRSGRRPGQTAGASALLPAPDADPRRAAPCGGGHQVEVMIPDVQRLAVLGPRVRLLRRGPARRQVELYRYDNGFLHAKLVIVDDTLASVGTANMDYRSLTDNLEVTAFIRDRETVRQLAATFDDDLASCRRITRQMMATAG